MIYIYINAKTVASIYTTNITIDIFILAVQTRGILSSLYPYYKTGHDTEYKVMTSFINRGEKTFVLFLLIHTFFKDIHNDETKPTHLLTSLRLSSVFLANTVLLFISFSTFDNAFPLATTKFILCVDGSSTGRELAYKKEASSGIVASNLCYKDTLRLTIQHTAHVYSH